MKALHPDQPALILASGSPRRLQLCRRIGFEPLLYISSVEEQRASDEDPVSYARRLAAEKAADVAAKLVDEPTLPGWILSADTIVVHEHDVLEKPADPAEARSMLHRLSGEKHVVITAFCWLWRAPAGGEAKRKKVVRDVRASVWLRELDDEMIDRYVASGEPMDKAGSYGIQDVGSVLVRRVEGSFYCVVGLPVCEVVETLQELSGLESYPF